MSNPSNIPPRLFNLISQFLSKNVRSVYYTAKTSVGRPKRDIVVQQVDQACQSLQETRDEFADALERFKTLVTVNEHSLEHRYTLLNRQYQFCCIKTATVSERIDAIELVSASLFAEWEKELGEYSNRTMQRNSKKQLKDAKENYGRLIKAMRRAEGKIHPVLSAFKDQVLYLKHNLNARAIAALQNEFLEISLDISELIKAMEQTIKEANQFVGILVDQKALPQQ